MSEYASLRVLVVRDNWIGCTGLSGFMALLRKGVAATSITEAEYVPIYWGNLPMKIAGRLLRPAAIRQFNRALMEEVRSGTPDLFLVFKGQFVRRETLRQIGELGTARYCFYPDVSTTTHGPDLPRALPEYDWIFSTKSFGPADLKERYGITRCSYLPHAYDPLIHAPRVPSAGQREQYSCDVSFIGIWSPKKERLLTELVTRLPRVNLKVWGDRWNQVAPGSPLRPCLALHVVKGPEYAAAIACSKINLALLSERVPGASSGDLITSRTFHLPGAGGFMLHERTADLLAIFQEDVHCACFDGVDEMIAKIERYLGDGEARRRIAAAGMALVHRSHSWDDRVQTILDHFLASRAGAQPAQAGGGAA